MLLSRPVLDQSGRWTKITYIDTYTIDDDGNYNNLHDPRSQVLAQSCTIASVPYLPSRVGLGVRVVSMHMLYVPSCRGSLRWSRPTHPDARLIALCPLAALCCPSWRFAPVVQYCVA